MIVYLVPLEARNGEVGVDPLNLKFQMVVSYLLWVLLDLWTNSWGMEDSRFSWFSDLGVGPELYVESLGSPVCRWPIAGFIRFPNCTSQLLRILYTYKYIYDFQGHIKKPPLIQMWESVLTVCETLWWWCPCKWTKVWRSVYRYVSIFYTVMKSCKW